MDALIFNLDQDNRPLKEVITPASLEVSPFKEQYQKSLSEIEAYLNTLSDDSVDKDMEYANNVFAFTGDRGSGKTSCMVSVGGFLSKDKMERAVFRDKYPNISATNFYPLDLMDPSYFDSKHNILSLFLAKLFKAYQTLTNRREILKESKKMDFLASLTRAQKHAHLLIDAKSDVLITNKVEELECLSVAVDLKEDIREVVSNFLECLNSENQILLLRIDDIDLNAKEAGVMAEMIRKYFILPNVLVLMALKMNQLEIIKQNEYAKLFEVEKDDRRQVVEMAERYLTKLFPHSQRVYMPDIEDLLNRKLIISSCKKKVEYPSVQQCVPELIFQKTRYLFYNSPVHASFIVPRNLRDLRQIIKLLWNMDDYKENMSDDFQLVKVGHYNQAVFKKYLAEVWINNNLSSDKQEFARQILATEELMRLNSFVVKELDNTYYSVDEFIRPYTNDENSVYNISLGDVLGVIEYLYRKTNSSKEQKFYFFIKTVYSMRIYEAYNKMSEPQKLPPFVCNTETSSSSYSKEILRNSQYSYIKEFDKLISGSYINVKLQPLFPPDMALDYRYIVGTELYSLMNVCSENFETAENGNLLRLLEFFMLCTSHQRSLDADFRKREFVVYDATIPPNVDLVFDIGSFFFNITRIKKCYQRFRGIVNMPDGQDLIDRILLSEHTLYHDFMLFTKGKDKYKCSYKCSLRENNPCESKQCNYYNSRWLSFCTIRNVEILQDFLKTIQKVEIDRTRQDCENLACFFENCSKYEIPTYDFDLVDNGKCYHKIRYDFLEKVAQLLRDGNVNDRFRLIFGDSPQMSKTTLMEDHL